MKTLKTFITVLIVFIVIQSYGQIKKLNTNQSNLTWTGKAAYSGYKLTGSIKSKTGFIEIDKDTIKKLSITVNMKSINHEYSDLKNHLKSKDFFEVEKFEYAHFELIKPCIIENYKAILVGNMNIKGVIKEKEITINFKKDYQSISFETILNRTDYGIKFNSPSFFKKLKENAIADEFKLEGNLQFKN